MLVLWFGLATEASNLQQQLGFLQTQDAALQRAVRLGHVAAFYEAVEAVCTEEKRFRLILCFYPMLLLLRLFKSFAAQPRLAVVTDTIKLASQDLLHFGTPACMMCAGSTAAPQTAARVNAGFRMEQVWTMRSWSTRRCCDRININTNIDINQ